MQRAKKAIATLLSELFFFVTAHRKLMGPGWKGKRRKRRSEGLIAVDKPILQAENVIKMGKQKTGKAKASR